MSLVENTVPTPQDLAVMAYYHDWASHQKELIHAALLRGDMPDHATLFSRPPVTEFDDLPIEYRNLTIQGEQNLFPSYGSEIDNAQTNVITQVLDSAHSDQGYFGTLVSDAIDIHIIDPTPSLRGFRNQRDAHSVKATLLEAVSLLPVSGDHFVNPFSSTNGVPGPSSRKRSSPSHDVFDSDDGVSPPPKRPKTVATPTDDDSLPPTERLPATSPGGDITYRQPSSSRSPSPVGSTQVTHPCTASSLPTNLFDLASRHHSARPFMEIRPHKLWCSKLKPPSQRLKDKPSKAALSNLIIGELSCNVPSRVAHRSVATNKYGDVPREQIFETAVKDLSHYPPDIQVSMCSYPANTCPSCSVPILVENQALTHQKCEMLTFLSRQPQIFPTQQGIYLATTKQAYCSPRRYVRFFLRSLPHNHGLRRYLTETGIVFNDPIQEYLKPGQYLELRPYRSSESSTADIAEPTDVT